MARHIYQVDEYGTFANGRTLDDDGAEIPAGWHVAESYEQLAEIAAYKLRHDGDGVVAMTTADTAARLARIDTARPDAEIAAAWRGWRARELAQTDHGMLSDAPYTAESVAAVQQFRASLRDMPQSNADPRQWARPARPAFVKREG